MPRGRGRKRTVGAAGLQNVRQTQAQRRAIKNLTSGNVNNANQSALNREVQRRRLNENQDGGRIAARSPKVRAPIPATLGSPPAENARENQQQVQRNAEDHIQPNQPAVNPIVQPQEPAAVPMIPMPIQPPGHVHVPQGNLIADISHVSIPSIDTIAHNINDSLVQNACGVNSVADSVPMLSNATITTSCMSNPTMITSSNTAIRAGQSQNSACLNRIQNQLSSFIYVAGINQTGVPSF